MRLTLRYLAIIPVGHDVTVQWVERPGLWDGSSEAQPILLDRVTRIVWGSLDVPEQLDHTRFAVEQHTSRLRQSKPMTNGRVLSCQIATGGSGNSSHSSTILEIEPLPGEA